jgi:hypothetical protein
VEKEEVVDMDEVIASLTESLADPDITATQFDERMLRIQALQQEQKD